MPEPLILGGEFYSPRFSDRFWGPPNPFPVDTVGKKAVGT